MWTTGRRARARRARRPAWSCPTRPDRRRRPAGPRRGSAGAERGEVEDRAAAGLRRHSRGRGRSAPCRRTARPRAGAPSSVCSNGSPDLACRNHTRSPIPSSAAAGPVSGVCTSPAPSSPVRCSPAGAHGVGSRSAPAGPEATKPPPCTVATCGRGPADDRQPEERRRAAAGRTGSGRTASGTSSPEPAATSVTTGSAAVASTEPEPPAFQNSRSATLAQRVGDLAAAYLELGQRQRLEPAHDQRPRALASVRRPGPRRPGPRRSSRRPAGSPGRSPDARGRARPRRAASCSGERLGPTCWPPIRSPASMSMATRTGTAVRGPAPSRPRRGGRRRRPSA